MKPEPADIKAPARHLVRPLTPRQRLHLRVASLLVGAGLVVFLNLVPLNVRGVDISLVVADWISLPGADGTIGSERNWLSVQTFLWLSFMLGLGELWIRRRQVRAEAWLLKIGLLPEDERTMLTSEQLAPIYTRARTTAPDAVLPALLRRLVMEFRKSNSVDRVNAVLDSSLELMMHQIDLRFTLLRYLVWIIPTLGFVGTVIGIASALAFVGSGELPPDELLVPTTLKLGVAFHTTLLALLQSAVLMLGMNLIQASDEQLLNQAGQYCLENLVIRLVEPAQLRKTA